MKLEWKKDSAGNWAWWAQACTTTCSTLSENSVSDYNNGWFKIDDSKGNLPGWDSTYTQLQRDGIGAMAGKNYEEGVKAWADFADNVKKDTTNSNIIFTFFQNYN